MMMMPHEQEDDDAGCSIEWQSICLDSESLRAATPRSQRRHLIRIFAATSSASSQPPSYPPGGSSSDTLAYVDGDSASLSPLTSTQSKGRVADEVHTPTATATEARVAGGKEEMDESVSTCSVRCGVAGDGETAEAPGHRASGGIARFVEREERGGGRGGEGGWQQQQQQQQQQAPPPQPVPAEALRGGGAAAAVETSTPKVIQGAAGFSVHRGNIVDVVMLRPPPLDVLGEPWGSRTSNSTPRARRSGSGSGSGSGSCSSGTLTLTLTGRLSSGKQSILAMVHEQRLEEAQQQQRQQQRQRQLSHSSPSTPHPEQKSWRPQRAEALREPHGTGECAGDGSNAAQNFLFGRDPEEIRRVLAEHGLRLPLDSPTSVEGCCASEDGSFARCNSESRSIAWDELSLE